MQKCIALITLILLAVPHSIIFAKSSPVSKPILIHYTLPEESNVSLAVFDPQGHLIRTLLKDIHQRKGDNVAFWNGRDQYGDPVSPGAYQIRGVWHPPISLQYLMTIDNPGTPPWPTLDGKGDWLSDEAAPQGVTTDGRNVFIAAPGCESERR